MEGLLSLSGSVKGLIMKFEMMNKEKQCNSIDCIEDEKFLQCDQKDGLPSIEEGLLVVKAGLTYKCHLEIDGKGNFLKNLESIRDGEKNSSKKLIGPKVPGSPDKGDKVSPAMTKITLSEQAIENERKENVRMERKKKFDLEMAKPPTYIVQQKKKQRSFLSKLIKFFACKK